MPGAGKIFAWRFMLIRSELAVLLDAPTGFAAASFAACGGYPLPGRCEIAAHI